MLLLLKFLKPNSSVSSLKKNQKQKKKKKNHYNPRMKEAYEYCRDTEGGVQKLQFSVFGCLLLFLLLFLAAPLWQKLATQNTLLWVDLRATQSEFFGNFWELQMCRRRWEMYVQSAKRGKQRKIASESKARRFSGRLRGSLEKSKSLFPGEWGRSLTGCCRFPWPAVNYS